jgi:hypothetical protein
VWSVPFWDNEDPTKIKWIGPCRTKDEAHTIAVLQPQAIKPLKSRYTAGKPIKMPLKTWLIEHTNYDSTDLNPQ